MAVQFALLDQTSPRVTVVHEYGQALADILSRLVVDLSAEPGLAS
jgi:hypothetical protein